MTAHEGQNTKIYLANYKNIEVAPRKPCGEKWDYKKIRNYLCPTAKSWK
jgi:hypothetical protein